MSFDSIVNSIMSKIENEDRIEIDTKDISSSDISALVDTLEDFGYKVFQKNSSLLAVRL